MQVEQVRPQVFDEKSKELQAFQTVFPPIYSLESDFETGIKNFGAKPCAILYRVNYSSNKIASGHFNLPVAALSNVTPDSGLHVSDESRKEFIKVTKELTDLYGRNNIHLFVFGQNFLTIFRHPDGSVLPDTSVIWTIINKARNILNEEILTTGAKAHDLRVMMAGSVTSTLYHPKERKIFWLIEQGM